MMRTRSLIMALVVTLLAPLPLLAQQGGGQGRGGMGGGMMGARALLEQGSVEFLAGKAADLNLTEEQTAGLKEIGAKWAADTKDSREKIRAEMPQPGQAMGDREAMMARMRALQPMMQALQQEDEKAMAEAMLLLDETQQAAAKKLIEERRAAGQRRPGGQQ